MEIFEVSRFSQLTDSARMTVGKAGAEYGVTVDMLADEIRSRVNGMNVADAVKAGGWYFDANAFAAELASKYGTTTELAAGIISAVSPRMPWLRNKYVAESILARLGEVASLSAKDAASALKLGLGDNVSMAVKIARGANIAETLTGVKRRSFYNNIVAPTTNDSVTVDTWMMVAFCNVTGTDKATALKFIRANEKALNGTGSGYILIAEAVRKVAQEMDLMPHQVQAIYWVAVSGDYNGGRTDISK